MEASPLYKYLEGAQKGAVIHWSTENMDASGNCVGVLQQRKDALGLTKGRDTKIKIGHKDVLENETLKSLFTGTMDKDKDKEKESNSRIYKIYEAYKQWLQKGKDPRTIGNGTYLLMDDTLYCQIQNQWGAEVDIEEPLSNAKAKEAVCTLGHLGMLTMVKALQTHFSILIPILGYAIVTQWSSLIVYKE
ncbi:hypothetical protein V8E53_014146 [Lactarius tabidus]